MKITPIGLVKVIGVVHQVQRDGVYINIEQAELRMPKSEQIHMERYRRGETLRAIIKSVEVTAKGPDIIVSQVTTIFCISCLNLRFQKLRMVLLKLLL